MKDSVTIDLGGRLLTIETGQLAKQSDGAAVVRSGDTVVLTAGFPIGESGTTNLIKAAIVE